MLLTLMEIKISHDAHKWFVDEMGLEKGDGVRFFGKIYGSTNVHDNFSVGIQVNSPENPLSVKEVNGIKYFMEKNDAWFFSGYNFEVTYNEDLDEVAYLFTD